MTGDPGRGTVPCQLTRHATPGRSALDRHGDGRAFGRCGPYPREHLVTTLVRIPPRRIVARNIHQHRLGWHARDIAVEEAGQ
jgi:hypothetical protein